MNSRWRVQWRRTVIGGETAPHDFSAVVETTSLGRIMRTDHGPIAGTWSYSFYPCDSRFKGTHGRAESKSEAAEALTAIIHRFSDTPTIEGGGFGKEPEECYGRFHNELSLIKQDRPDDFRRMIDEIRSGQDQTAVFLAYCERWREQYGDE